MIDQEIFTTIWKRLCRRWDQKLDTEEATLYRAYLERQGLDTEGFVGAAEALWATREFFPRPADFLLIRAARDWNAIVRFVRETDRPRESVSERGWKALSSIGGLSAVGESRNLARFRREFLHAYELRVSEETSESAQALLAPTPRALQP